MTTTTLTARLTKGLALAAASTLVLSAASAQDVLDAGDEPIVQTDEAAPDDDENMLETLLSDEQPPLEGDSPFVDAEDVAESEGDDALVGAPYAEETTAPIGLDDPADDDVVAAEVERDEDPLADPVMGADEPMLAVTPDDEGLTSDDAPQAAEADSDLLEADAPEMASDADTAAPVMAAPAGEPADPVTGREALPAQRERIAAVPTDPNEAAVEAAMIAGTYDVTIPGRDQTSTLFIEGRGTEAAGTFDGEPIEVVVTGRNFSFDAPVDMGGETQLMTFAGTVEDGVIDNGVIAAEGDGGFLTFDATRADAMSTEADAGVTGADATADFDTGVESVDTEADAAMPMAEEVETLGAEMDAGADAMADDADAAVDEATDGLSDSVMMDEADTDAGMTDDADVSDALAVDADEDASSVMDGGAMETESATDALTDDDGLGDMESMETDTDEAESFALPQAGEEVPSDVTGDLQRDADSMEMDDTEMDADDAASDDMDADDPNFDF